MQMKNKINYISTFIVLLLIMKISCGFSNDKFLLSAQSISKNENNNTITAKGNVNIKSDNYKLKANEIVYYLEEKKVYAIGNVIIFEKSGNVIYASEAELANDLKSNFIKNVGILLSDNSRLAAGSAKSIRNSNKTIYKNVVFTKCENCEEKTKKRVMWKLKAKKATHLKNSKIILYENVYIYRAFYKNNHEITLRLHPKFNEKKAYGVAYDLSYAIGQLPYFLTKSYSEM